LQGMLNWPRGAAFLRAGAVFVRAGELGQGPGGARPPAGGAGGVLDAGAREPM